MGLTIIDAGVVIGTLDANDAHHEAALEALRTGLDRGDRFAVPASVYAETLVGPFRRGDEAVVEAEAFFADMGIRIEPISREIARLAARLRAEHGRGLRLPDALVIATTEALQAECAVTTDRGWPRDLTIAVKVL